MRAIIIRVPSFSLHLHFSQNICGGLHRLFEHTQTWPVLGPPLPPIWHLYWKSLVHSPIHKPAHTKKDGHKHLIDVDLSVFLCHRPKSAAASFPAREPVLRLWNRIQSRNWLRTKHLNCLGGKTGDYNCLRVGDRHETDHFLTWCSWKSADWGVFSYLVHTFCSTGHGPHTEWAGRTGAERPSAPVGGETESVVTYTWIKSHLKPQFGVKCCFSLCMTVGSLPHTEDCLRGVTESPKHSTHWDSLTHSSQVRLAVFFLLLKTLFAYERFR